ncbi:hypothetical protein KIW84_012422 [Lathyrus oleraceus]|uniref:Uncharacterized protein n=1 Tax=Pisum sativum TaxID=3888 RepID=A0A9D5GWQ7_PEA|nr:hypothetical protein KIW84_012422 [Pisum sativum]
MPAETSRFFEFGRFVSTKEDSKKSNSQLISHEGPGTTSPNNSYFNGSPSSPYSGGGGLSWCGGNPALASFMTNQLGIGNNGKSTAGGGLQAPYVDPLATVVSVVLTKPVGMHQDLYL